ncbi:MAG: thermonuclease family protein [Candidatus Omnitrophota bacterium]
MQKRLYFFAVLLLTCIAASATLATGCARQSSAAQAEYIVKKVIDGDTIELSNGSRVRYIGIDTPEVRKREGTGWKYAPEPYALKAKTENNELVAGKKVKLEFDAEKEDKYGRLLAYVYVDGKMVNAELLRRGCASVYMIPPNTKHLALLTAAQEEAKRAKRGIWQL